MPAMKTETLGIRLRLIVFERLLTKDHEQINGGAIYARVAECVGSIASRQYQARHEGVRQGPTQQKL